MFETGQSTARRSAKTRGLVAAMVATFACAGLCAAGCDEKATTPAAASETKPATPLYAEGSPQRSFLKFTKIARAVRKRALPAVGRVTFDEARVVNITTPIAGRVTEVRASVGQVVRKGQALVAIDSPEITALRADLRKAELDLHAAQRNLKRVESLVAEKAAARKEVLSARIDRDKAKAEIERLRTRFALLHVGQKEGTQRITIRAPRAGVIVKRQTNVGEEARPDSALPLFVLADLSSVWVVADVPEREARLVHVDQGAHVQVSAFPGRSFEGSVQYIGAAINPETRALQVRIVIDNEERLLRPEMYARIALEVPNEGPRILVPTKALVVRRDETVVYVDEGAGKITPRKVQLGAELGDEHEIIGGLREGETIVVEGALLLDGELEKVL